METNFDFQYEKIWGRIENQGWWFGTNNKANMNHVRPLNTCLQDRGSMHRSMYLEDKLRPYLTHTLHELWGLFT